MTAAGGLPLVTRAGRIANQCDALLDHLLNIDVRAEVAAPDHVSHGVDAGLASACDLDREIVQRQHLAIDETDVEVLVEQLNALVHVVEHDLHHLARALGVGPGRLGRLFGGCERRLAFLQLGDVAVNAQDGAVFERLVAHLDVMPARRRSFKPDTARRAQVFDKLSDFGLGVGESAEIAAFDLESAHVAHQAAGEHHLGRVALELHHAAVDELDAHVVVVGRHQRDAVVHVVDHGGEHRAGALKLGRALAHLLEQPHRLDRNHRLVGEGRDQLDLPCAERARHVARKRDHSDRRAFAQQRHAEHGAVVANRHRLRPGVLGVGKDVRNVDRGAFQGDAPHQRAAVGYDLAASDVIQVRVRKAEVRGKPEEAPLAPEDEGALGLAHPRRRFHQRVEHGLQLEGGAAHDVQHVGSGR
jgi:hypothetical protein